MLDRWPGWSHVWSCQAPEWDNKTLEVPILVLHQRTSSKIQYRMIRSWNQIIQYGSDSISEDQKTKSIQSSNIIQRSWIIGILKSRSWSPGMTLLQGSLGPFVIANHSSRQQKKSHMSFGSTKAWWFKKHPGNLTWKPKTWWCSISFCFLSSWVLFSGSMLILAGLYSFRCVFIFAMASALCLFKRKVLEDHVLYQDYSFIYIAHHGNIIQHFLSYFQFRPMYPQDLRKSL